MLTVGDDGCGAIYNNQNYYDDAGISGWDFIVQIDAELNSVSRGNNGNIYPNRFGFNEDHKICYSDTGYGPDTIFARNNYWDTMSPPISGYLSLMRCHYVDHCFKPPSESSCIGMILDTSNVTQCEQAADCMTCGTKNWDNLFEGDVAVYSAYEEAYDQFINVDDYNNRSNFASLANLALVKDSTPESIKWSAIELIPGHDTVEISTQSAQLIMASKVIYGSIGAFSSGKLRAETREPIFQNYLKEKDLKIRLTPNPTYGTVLLERINSDPNQCYLNVYNSQGQLKLKNLLFKDKINIDLSNFSSSCLSITTFPGCITKPKCYRNKYILPQPFLKYLSAEVERCSMASPSILAFTLYR